MENTISSLTFTCEDCISCPICLEQLESKVISELSCSHSICEDCFKNLITFSNKCPLCLKMFTRSLYKQGSTILSEFLISDVEIDRITKHRNSLFNEENFECFSREEIKRELTNYKNIVQGLEINLFMHRNSDGSEKEYSIYSQVVEILYSCHELISLEQFDKRTVMKNLEDCIQGIKDLQMRKYRFFYEYDNGDSLYYDEGNADDNFSCKYAVEYVNRKKSGAKKKKKK